MASIWEELSLYESRDLISKFYKKRNNRKLSSEKSLEIVSHIAQGREYFESAKQSADLVRPLLLYYGVLSFSRAVILFLNTESRANSIGNSHGLKTENWGNILSKGIGELPKVGIRITKGTFLELSRVTLNIERSYVYTGPYPSQRKVFTCDNKSLMGLRITLKEVLAQIQVITELYIYTFNEFSDCFHSNVFTSNTQTDYSIFETEIGLPEADYLKKKFNLPPEIHIRMKESDYFFGNIKHLAFRITHTSLDETNTIDIAVKNDLTGRIYSVSPFENGIKLSSLSYLFLASYFMGMLVRYFPSHWLSLINRNNGDQVYPLLKATSNLIELKFPKLILEVLTMD